MEIYAFAFCFVSGIFFVFSFGFLVWNFVELSVPEFTLDAYRYECHQSDHAYRDCFSPDYKGNKDYFFPQGSELTDMRIADYAQAIRSERRDAVRGVAQKLIILLINALVFILHWLLAKRAGGMVEITAQHGYDKAR